MEMEKMESEEIELPKGGPIYIGNMVSPLTRVIDFEAKILQELQELEAELCLDLSQLCDDDLSIDELKVYAEEELMDMALKEAFQDEVNAENSSQPSEEHSSAGKKFERSGKEENRNSSKKKKKKRKTNRLTADTYIAKVRQLSTIKLIKQKQDEDKAAARLHSLNSSCKSNEFSIPSSDKTERMKSLRSTNSAKPKAPAIQKHVAVTYPETVLCVEVYHHERKWVKTQEFLVIGRQMLTELRDKICCQTDQLMQNAGQFDPSGYFLIEDVFYNDLRHPSAIDYSEPIFNWLRNSKDEALKKWDCIINGELQQKQKALLGSVSTSHMPHFKTVDMQKARFCDFRFRLGAGYLYCHQGDCKHTMVIRDMRLIHPEDVHNRAAYPIVTFQLKQRSQKCNVCKIYMATKEMEMCMLYSLLMQACSSHVRIMVFNWIPYRIQETIDYFYLWEDLDVYLTIARRSITSAYGKIGSLLVFDR